MMKKFLVLLLTLCMALAAVLSGCTPASDAGTTTAPTTAATQAPSTQAPAQTEEPFYVNLDSELPIVNEPITLTVLTQKYAGALDWDEMWFWKWAKEYTGITYDVTEYDSEGFEEKANLLFATQNIPDMLHCVGSYLTNDRALQYGQEEGMLLALNDLIDQYAPNIVTVFEENPLIRQISTCPDGNIYTLPDYGRETYDVMCRPFINDAWLQNLSLEMPSTTEEFYNVLTAFKEQDANGNGDPSDEIPYGGSWNEGNSVSTFFLCAFGMPANDSMELYAEDGVVMLPAFNSSYLNYLQYVNQLYSEGLIDGDIFTQTVTQARAKSTSNLTGVAFDGSTFIIGGESYWHDWVGLSPVTSPVNDTPTWRLGLTASAGRFAASAETQYPEAVIRFANLFFTLKASVFFQWGPQKDSEEALGYEGWYIVDDQFQFDYPEGYDNSWTYRLSMIVPMASKMGSREYFKGCEEVYGFTMKLDDYGIYFREEVDKAVGPYLHEPFPAVYLTPEQLERRNEIYTTLKTFVTTEEAKFLTGEKAPTQENFDAYLQELKNLDVEEYIEIYQIAYDAMMN